MRRHKAAPFRSIPVSIQWRHGEEEQGSGGGTVPPPRPKGKVPLRGQRHNDTRLLHRRPPAADLLCPWTLLRWGERKGQREKRIKQRKRGPSRRRGQHAVADGAPTEACTPSRAEQRAWELDVLCVGTVRGTCRRGARHRRLASPSPAGHRPARSASQQPPQRTGETESGSGSK
jgi:hypothetical protein